jgi:APA family basic amino acid/polyamine antiporter
MNNSGLSRGLGLLALTSTGICAMLGASINVVPFMIHRSVPDLGPYVLPAFLFAALPAILAAIAYASLSTAIPKAGGSYLYASRGISPFLGFVASFSQWFGLSIVIGVIAYIIVPFIRDLAIALSGAQFANTLENGLVRVTLALFMIWFFVWINIRGAKFYERVIIPMMIFMFGLGSIVIVKGFGLSQDTFIEGWIQQNDLPDHLLQQRQSFSWSAFFSAGAVLFSSFIGFDAIAQAGGEARNPKRNLPLAIGLAVLVVGSYYLLFSGAVYHAIPWQLVRSEALNNDISAPGLLSVVMSPGWGVAILLGAIIALINDLPAMLLSVSRLTFAWAEDRIFPQMVEKIHPEYHTPVNALIFSGIFASIGVLGSHFAGDFFLGIDIMVTSMMVNFLIICLSLVTIHRRNPELADKINLITNTKLRKFLGLFGAIVLLFFLINHTHKDLANEVDAWYFHSTWIWLIVMGLGSTIFFYKTQKLRESNINLKEHFSNLPKD